MTRRLTLLAATAIVALTMAILGPATASALSCAPHPDASPESIGAGTEQTASGTRVLDDYDMVVIGTVTAVETLELEGPAYGHTTITMEVHGVLGSTERIAEIELSADDPGWLSGYPFEVGHHYSVPVLATGPDGQPNHTFLCFPITEIDDPDRVVADLIEITAASGVDLARPPLPTADTTPPPAAPGTGSDDDVASVLRSDNLDAIAAPGRLDTDRGWTGRSLPWWTGVVVVMLLATVAVAASTRLSGQAR